MRLANLRLRLEAAGNRFRIHNERVGAVVDLMGRLSNPPEPLETLTPLGVRGIRRSRERRSKQPIHSPTSSESAGPETPGRLSNPRPTVLRRLSHIEIDEIVCSYRAGRTLADLAAEMGVHRRTVATHLDSRGVARRVNRRKVSDDDVRGAALRYRDGNSLAAIALTLNVDASTSTPQRFAASSIAQESPSDHDLGGSNPDRGWPTRLRTPRAVAVVFRRQPSDRVWFDRPAIFGSPSVPAEPDAAPACSVHHSCSPRRYPASPSPCDHDPGELPLGRALDASPSRSNHADPWTSAEARPDCRPGSCEVRVSPTGENGARRCSPTRSMECSRTALGE